MKIFTEKLQKVENSDCNIYGYGFENFYLKTNQLENMQIEDKNKINILITHANLDGSDTSGNEYNNISSRMLKGKGFDYVALGHIHKRDMKTYENIVYPGSAVSLGFDELGTHGMVVRKY